MRFHWRGMLLDDCVLDFSCAPAAKMSKHAVNPNTYCVLVHLKSPARLPVFLMQFLFNVYISQPGKKKPSPYTPVSCDLSSR